MEISIIIVNYNGKEFLRECLDSIRKFLDISYEVIIVDNASIDGSQEYIKAEFPWVKLVESRENLGFAKGNNLGAEYATGDHILLLNNDTKLFTSLSKGIHYMKENEGIGIVGCRMVNPDGSIQPSCGFYHAPFRLITGWMVPTMLKWPSFIQLYEKRPSFYSKTHSEVDWVSGAFMLIKRVVWEKLKGLDSNFFMYLEDVDFCYRASKAGWKTAYFSDLSVLHYEGGTESWRSLNAFLYTMDSCRIYLLKHYGRISWYSVQFFLALIMLTRGCIHSLCGVTALDREGMKKGRIYFAAARRLFL